MNSAGSPSVLSAAVGLLLLGAMIAIGVGVYREVVAYPRTAGPGTGQKVTVAVERGSGPDRISTILEDAGVIASGSRFSVYLRMAGRMSEIRAGTFVMTDDMTPEQVFDTLRGRPHEKGIRVTIPEGFRLSQVAHVLSDSDVVDAASFQAAVTDRSLLDALDIPGPSAEGFLFPDTYYFSTKMTADTVVRRMYRNFLTRTETLNLGEGAERFATVTLASIVQAEVRIPEEAPLIAAVYRNRLVPERFPLGRLQADPTVAYGCDPMVPDRGPSCRTFRGVLRSRQLQDDLNPYNTYRHAGLPPGPICAPGIVALSAVLNPADVPYLYFVVETNGKHTFSATWKEHTKAVQAYRKRQAARAGTP
jgi:UPF0755 protein